jgi:putative transcriptional regulator
VVTLCNRRYTLIKNRLKVLRAERDWTQEELAIRAKISRQAVISIEKYKYQPSLELAFTLSEVFGLPITEVFIHQKEEEK